MNKLDKSKILAKSSLQEQKLFWQNYKSRIFTVVNVVVDGLPIIGLANASTSFVKSLKDQKWKLEIYRLAAVLGCTPFEMMTLYHTFVDKNLSDGASYYMLSKFIYRSIYMIYICKKESIDIQTFMKKMKTDFRFNTKMRKKFQEAENNDNLTSDFGDESISRIAKSMQEEYGNK